jgi:ATP-dependent helicase/nuclease subunit B
MMLDVAVTNAAELAFLKALAVTAPEFVATVPAADESTLLQLRDRLCWAVENLDSQRAAASGLSDLQHNLFREGRTPASSSPAGDIDIFSAPGEGRECVEIARRLLARVREGIPFDRMAVLLRSSEEYRANLEEAFGRARIPVHFARGARRPDPAGRAFSALLRCALEGLSARRFAEYLSLGQVPDVASGGIPPEASPRGDQWVEADSEIVTQEAVEVERGSPEPVEGNAEIGAGMVSRGGGLPAPRRWEQLLVDAAVIGSRARWQRRLDGLGNELRVRLTELSEEEAQAAAVARTIDDLKAFTAYALPLIDMLDG